MKNEGNNGRRDFLKKASMLAVTSFILPSLAKASPENYFETSNILEAENTLFTLPQLNYSYDALEPYIDKTTMEIHHTKHHQAYVDKLNQALIDSNIKHTSIEEICKNISKYSKAVRNNGGGHYNHSLFWKLISPKGSNTPTGELAQLINANFGTIDNLKLKFNEAAKSQFGSGWAWLVLNKKGKLEIGTTANQDNPLMDICDFKGTPIFALDVWEHAYYLKYQNKRVDYISAWWNVLNWDVAENNYLNAK